MSQGTLRLVCVKCTRGGDFAGAERRAAITAALKAGWVRRGSNVVCPRCPA